MLVKKLDKTVSKIMQFVKSFASDDEARPILQTVHFNEKYLVAADGFRLVVVEKPEELKDISGNYQTSKIKAGENYVELVEQDGNFPDWEQVAPCTTNQELEEGLTFALNPGLLVDLVKMADNSKPIKITVRKPSQPVEISGHIKQGKYEDSTPFYAVIMPMHMDHHDKGFQPK